MLMMKERKELVKYGKKMSKYGLTEGTTGNLSIYDPLSNTIAITPSGVSYKKTKPEDIVVMDLNGNILDGIRKPSSEYHLHAEIYKNHGDSRGVVHTHSTYCTVFSCLNKPIEGVHYALADAKAPAVPVAEYATYGTLELAENAVKAISGGSGIGIGLGDSKAVLLANHGMLSYGDSIKEAFSIAQTCEWVAKIQWKAMCIGTPVILSDREMNRIAKKFETYGQIAMENSEDDK